LVFASAWFTENIGVHAIFGGFIMGVITPRKNRFAIQMTERLEDLTLTLLLPLYFTLSGLSTNIASINTPTAGGYLVLIIVAAVIAKIGSASLAAKFCQNNWRDSITIGVLMNAKGLVELIVLNIGLQAGVLSVEIFSMFVVMCIVTTCMTSPLVYFIYLKKKREQVIPKESHSFLLFVPDLKTATDAVTCVSAFSGTSDTTKVVYLNEISERPSSYFFQFSRKHATDGAPSFKDKSHEDIMSSVRKHGSNQGLIVKSKILTSNEMALDVVSMADGHACNMIIFGINGESERETEPKSNALSRSLSTFVSLQMGGYMGWHSVASSAFTAAKARTSARIAAYIHRGAGLSTIHRIVFPYTGDSSERAALDLVLLSNPSVHVDIYALAGRSPPMEGDNPNVSIVTVEDPFAAVSGAAKNSLEGFTLIVCGMDRADSNKAVVLLINEVSSCMLLVYNAISERKSRTLELDEMHTSLRTVDV